MDIPPNLMLNVKRALELIKSPKLKKEYQLYLKVERKNRVKKKKEKKHMKIIKQIMIMKKKCQRVLDLVRC